MLAKSPIPLNVEVPLPGTKFNLLDDGSVQINHPIEDVESQYSKENIKQYAQQYSYIFKERENQTSGYEPIQVQKLVRGRVRYVVVGLLKAELAFVP